MTDTTPRPALAPARSARRSTPRGNGSITAAGMRSWILVAFAVLFSSGLLAPRRARHVIRRPRALAATTTETATETVEVSTPPSNGWVIASATLTWTLVVFAVLFSSGLLVLVAEALFPLVLAVAGAALGIFGLHRARRGARLGALALATTATNLVVLGLFMAGALKFWVTFGSLDYLVP
jgi:hypothetical protein